MRSVPSALVTFLERFLFTQPMASSICCGFSESSSGGQDLGGKGLGSGRGDLLWAPRGRPLVPALPGGNHLVPTLAGGNWGFIPGPGVPDTFPLSVFTITRQWGYCPHFIGRKTDPHTGKALCSRSSSRQVFKRDWIPALPLCTTPGGLSVSICAGRGRAG